MKVFIMILLIFVSGYFMLFVLPDVITEQIVSNDRTFKERQEEIDHRKQSGPSVYKSKYEDAYAFAVRRMDEAQDTAVMQMTLDSDIRKKRMDTVTVARILCFILQFVLIAIIVSLFAKFSGKKYSKRRSDQLDALKRQYAVVQKARTERRKFEEKAKSVSGQLSAEKNSSRRQHIEKLEDKCDYFDAQADHCLENEQQQIRLLNQMALQMNIHMDNQRFNDWVNDMEFQRFTQWSLDESLKSVTPFEHGGYQDHAFGHGSGNDNYGSDNYGNDNFGNDNFGNDNFGNDYNNDSGSGFDSGGGFNQF